MVNRREHIEAILKERFSDGNLVELLQSGQGAFERIFEHVTAARKVICLEFYIYRNDETGSRLSELLIRKAEEGVRVYVLYDHFGSMGTPRSFWDKMRRAGVMVSASRPFKLRDPRGYLRRDHKKLIVIDGEISFAGGINIANEYSGLHVLYRPVKKRESVRGSWRDGGVILRGPVVSDLARYFKRAWRLWSNEDISLPLTVESYADGFQVIPIFASSARGSRRMRRLIYWSIENSERSIHITTAYFTPSLRMLEILRRAVERGVTVKLLLPGRSDVTAAHYSGRAFFTRLLRYGVQIYSYSGSILHAKSYLFDGIWSIIGSANLDFQSLRKNDEGNVGILSERFGEEMVRTFEEDIVMSEMIGLKEWLSRPLCEKVKERFFVQFRRRL